MVSKATFLTGLVFVLETDRNIYILKTAYLGKQPSIGGSLKAFGPLLFLIYVNDLVTVSKDILPVLFADDTNLVMSNINFDCLMSKADRGLKEFSN